MKTGNWGQSTIYTSFYIQSDSTAYREIIFDYDRMKSSISKLDGAIIGKSENERD